MYVTGTTGRPFEAAAGTPRPRASASSATKSTAPSCAYGVTNGTLAVVPYYVRPTEAAIVAHFQVVAARSPVPVCVYNIPYRTGRGLGASALLELAGTTNICGVKQAVGALDADTLAVLAAAPASFALLSGDDAFIFPTTLMGGRGAIAASANLCTGGFVEMVGHGLEGRVAQGRGYAEALLPLVLALFAEPSPSVVKGVLHARGLIPTPDVRMPLSAASAASVERAIAALDATATAVSGIARGPRVADSIETAMGTA